ncbi:alpha/beta hydrolase family protein [Sphingomonas sp. PB4P5]|uniref:alpha/beta hydrolase family protein n=1 Tax=Parasphingomonas puruogangriensis TaxID=3096155 RepID=UPI002FCA1930
MRSTLPLFAALLATPAALPAQHTPAAIYADPAPDTAHPAGMTVLHVPSGGVEINGIAYRPSGAGPHPVAIIAHGLPGNEKNLDLAQALRRAGWIAVTFNYRGSWGSPGTFRFAHNPDDAAAVIAWVRKNAASTGADPARIAIIGHSMGGWVAAKTIARDPRLLGAALISAADIGTIGTQTRAAVLDLMTDNRETLAATAAEMADEVIAHQADFALKADAPALAKARLLVLTSDDGLAPGMDALVATVRQAGGSQVKTRHVATDHGWSDHRIALQAAIMDWLATLK